MYSKVLYHHNFWSTLVNVSKESWQYVSMAVSMRHGGVFLRPIKVFPWELSNSMSFSPFFKMPTMQVHESNRSSVQDTTKTIYHPLQRRIASLLHDHHLQHHYQIESHYWRALLNLHRHNHHHYHDYQLIIPTSIGKISWYLKTQKYKESYLFQRVVNKHVLEVKG